MNAISKKLILIASTVIPVFASAHPGHGHENPLSPGHYFGNPEHYVSLGFTALALFSAWYFIKRILSKRTR